MQEFCSLYIFSEVPFERNKNPIIEDISGLYGITPNFLNNLTSVYSSPKWQLPKMTLTQDLVVEAGQGLVYSKNTPNDSTPRYVMYAVKIKDTGTNKYRYYYYYVDKVEWNAMSSVRLKLTMDTLNTYKGLFVFSNRTHITRKHSDRMWCNPTPFTSGGHTYYKMTRIVDRMSEGLNLPLEHYSQSFVHETGDSVSHSVLYRSNNLESSCGFKFYKVSSKENEQYTNTLSSLIMNLTFFYDMGNELGMNVGDEFYFMLTIRDNPLGHFHILFADSTTWDGDFDNAYYWLIRFTKGVDENHSSFHLYEIRRMNTQVHEVQNIVSIEVSNTIFGRLMVSNDSSLPELIDNMTNFDLVLEDVGHIPYTYSLLTIPGNYPIKSYKQINRLDPYHIKLIHIPYAINTTLNEDYDPRVQLMEIPSYELMTYGTSRTITSTSDSPLRPYWFVLRDPTTAGMKTQTHSISNDYESKMYHSDFYYTKLSYDTSSIIVHLENFDYHDIRLDWSLSAVLTFDFTLSLNLNSNMTFVFTDLEETFADNDFNYVLSSTRNNESMLFNNAYLDYLKNGYNYDKQNKDLQVKQAVQSNVLSGVASIVGGIIASGATENPMPLAAALIGVVGSAVNTKVQIDRINEQYRNSLAQKQTQLAMQGQTITGISDYDLFRTYSEDKVRIDKYRVIEPLQAMVENYFYLFGYKCDIYDSPDNHNTSRLWRNFIQADIDLDSDMVGGIDVDIAADIVNKFKEGVTYFHNVDDNYDFAQVMENWEKNVYNTILANE